MREIQKVKALEHLEKVKQIIVAEIPESEDYSDLTFGDRLKAIREARGYTKKELSKFSGVHPNLISSYENGSRLPNVANFEWLCKALKVSAMDLLGF